MRHLLRASVAFCIVIGFLLTVPNVNSQWKRQKPQNRAEDDLAAGTVQGPKDETLFDEYYLQRLRRLPGWRLVSMSEDDSDQHHVSAYYDPTKIMQKGNNLRLWVKYIDKQNGVEQSHTLTFQEYACDSEMVRTVESVDYDKEGDTTRHEAGRWYRVVPDSIGERIYKVICKHGVDAQEAAMRRADNCFEYGRQEEKQGKYELARYWYQDALTFAPGNAKVLAALRRIEKK